MSLDIRSLDAELDRLLGIQIAEEVETMLADGIAFADVEGYTKDKWNRFEDWKGRFLPSFVAFVLDRPTTEDRLQ